MMTQMNVRLSVDELNYVKQKAQEARMSVNNYVREILREAQIEIKVRSRNVGQDQGSV